MTSDLHGFIHDDKLRAATNGLNFKLRISVLIIARREDFICP